MSDVIFIFLMLGAAHWASHLFTCSSCQRDGSRLINFSLHAVIQVFGWPLWLISYLHQIFTGSEGKEGKPNTIDAFEDENQVMGIAQKPGESLEDFIRRAHGEAKAHMEKLKAKKEEDL